MANWLRKSDLTYLHSYSRGSQLAGNPDWVRNPNMRNLVNEYGQHLVPRKHWKLAADQLGAEEMTQAEKDVIDAAEAAAAAAAAAEPGDDVRQGRRVCVDRADLPTNQKVLNAGVAAGHMLLADADGQGNPGLAVYAGETAQGKARWGVVVFNGIYIEQ